MGSSESIELTSRAERATEQAEQLAGQASALDAIVARDERLVTDAREAGRDWERNFDAIDDPICIVAADYRLIYANAAYQRVFGTAQELGGRHYCFGPAPDHDSRTSATQQNRPCADCPLPKTVRLRRAGFTQQVWRSPAGSVDSSPARVYQRWTYPVFSADGTVERVVEVLKDVTEQELMRRSAARAAALREADRLKAELLGTVSHELRSPLAAIKGYAATLLRHERRLPREERREFLEAIGEASDRLEVIINRLLEMSQLETGGITPHLEPVDVAQVAREAIAAAEQRAGANEPGKHAFTFRVARTGGATGRAASSDCLVIDADARLVRDALDNLLENAVKYSPEGGRVEITLAVGAAAGAEPAPIAAYARDQAHDSDGARVVAAPPSEILEIVVRDTGVGIPPEHLGRVFERFHRVDTRLTRDVDGLGLGLAMCKRIAELHGGTIWVESAPGEGSAFHLALPLAVSSAGGACHSCPLGSRG